jgi:hypothetical protein
MLLVRQFVSSKNIKLAEARKTCNRAVEASKTALNHQHASLGRLN